MKSRGAAKPPTFALPFAARACHARLARLTRARGRRFLRGWKILLNDFWYFSSLKSTIKKSYFMIFLGRRGADPCLGDADTHAPHMCQFAYKIKPKYSQQTKQKIKVHFAFSFDEEGAKEKATKKKTPKEDFALCGVLTQSRRRRHTRSAYVSIPPFFLLHLFTFIFLLIIYVRPFFCLSRCRAPPRELPQKRKLPMTARRQ